MPVMQQAQEIFGYPPEEVQIKIAEGMEIPLEEVYGISTFYSLYDLNPKGQYKYYRMSGHRLLCQGLSGCTG